LIYKAFLFFVCQKVSIFYAFSLIF
jgi:hypothetical protein